MTLDITRALIGGRQESCGFRIRRCWSGRCSIRVIDAGGWCAVRPGCICSSPGIVYAMLLSHICVGDEQGWVDDVLQRIMPMVMIVDWMLAPVALGISGRPIAGWLVYPLGYGAYTLIRASRWPRSVRCAAVGAARTSRRERRSDVVVE
ncbi:Pr6Pr family membrane protein [Nocardia sp. NPDC052278]|uniref:Pr6Pr family membrane protein n=1 Tax=unclassified Nocardia TaxID=2637762 RepID=UPI0036A8956B